MPFSFMINIWKLALLNGNGPVALDIRSFYIAAVILSKSFTTEAASIAFLIQTSYFSENTGVFLTLSS